MINISNTLSLSLTINGGHLSHLTLCANHEAENFQINIESARDVLITRAHKQLETIAAIFVKQFFNCRQM